MRTEQVEIINKLGLHARAAAKLVTTASAYGSDIQLSFKGKQVNGKSIMGVMMLAAAKGTTLQLIVNGTDEQEAVRQLVALVGNKFEESE